MRHYDLAPLYRSSVGFDRLFSLIDQLGTFEQPNTAYPPYNIEKTGENAYRISVAVAGFAPEDLTIESLVNRVREGGVREVILAVNATVDGQTTAHYVTDRLAPTGVRVSRLAHGVPVGGELDYLDEGTLTAALRARRPV